MDFHHPLFQSLALPLGLALAAVGFLRNALGPERGPRWAASGLALALVVTVSWTLGWRWPPGAFTEKLPWLYAAASIIGVGLEAWGANRRSQWLVASLAWTVALLALGPASLLLKLASWLAGMTVICAVLNEAPQRADAAAVLVVASLGLAALAMMSGSALLFELNLALGAAVGGVALWLWPVTRIVFGPGGAVTAVLVWLALAQGTALLTPVHPGALLLLVAAFAAGPFVRAVSGGGEGRRPWVTTLIVAAVAALWVVAALLFAQFGGTGAAPTSTTDDPYYKPKW
ncbi:hypothetical protein QTI66_03665 [Variovorax sp. J22R133]|uniref:hypothetical protein n=1 Tax=Variovorax brevis TaxID=3053503 RepID=UPI0025753326|nr:hypothetical protein [Variovorax sp. J22R133]MDM0111229.1 hypothetical protein [Variovorax sp. J22R133]